MQFQEYKPNYQTVGYDGALSFYLRLKDSPKLILSDDIETAESIFTPEDTRHDLTSATITQIQFATDKFNAVIFPRFDGEYKEIAKKIYALPNFKANHNRWNFDDPILEANGIIIDPTKTHDTMWMFKQWQPMLPRGLQAVASLAGFPFAWKHLFGADMEIYGGCDVCSIHFILEWLVPLMKQTGTWAGYYNQVFKLHPILYNAAKLGLPVNDEKRVELRQKLIGLRNEKDNFLQENIPNEIKNISPKRKLRVKDTETGKEFDYLDYGYIREPSRIGEARGIYLETGSRLQKEGKRIVPFAGFVQRKYGLVHRRFKTLDKATGEETEIERWCNLLPFKASKEQLSKYINWKREALLKEYATSELRSEDGKKDKELKKLAEKYIVPKDHEGKETTRKDSIEELFEKTGDEVLQTNLEVRSISTAINNYTPNWRPSSIDGCVHTTWGFTAASGQIDSRRPNVLNCFSKDTEILTKRGWILFPNLLYIDEVAQFSTQFETIEFVKPLAFVKNFEKELINITTEDQLNLLVTKDHECLLKNRKRLNYEKFKAIDYKSDWLQIQAGTYYEGKINYRQTQIILICALRADGSIILNERQVNPAISFTFSKERKIESLRYALDLESIPYTEKFTNNGKTVFYIGTTCVPDWLKDKKVFGSWILDMDRESLDYMLDEVFRWDGNFNYLNQFASAKKENANWVQILQLLSCRRANLIEWQPKGKNQQISYQVLITKKPYSLTTNFQSEIVEYNDFVYCVTVPSGNIVVRRNNKVAITGNCGKHTEMGRLFRRIIEAPTGWEWIEADKKSFHVATMGYCANDKDYIRFSQLDPHSIFTSYIMPKEWGEPIEMSMSDGEILERSKWIKKRCKEEKQKGGDRGIDLRQQCAKPTVLGNQLGLGPKKLYWQNRRSMKDVAAAERYQEIIAELFPIVNQWKKDIKILAHKKTYLINEFGFIQWFFDVFNYTWNKIQNKWIEREGREARLPVAFRVQGCAFGMIKEELFRILKRCKEELDLGYFPFRLSIHDSLFFLIKDADIDRFIPIMIEEMNRPCKQLVNEATGPEGLVVGIEYSLGRNWQSWDKDNNPEGMKEIG